VHTLLVPTHQPSFRILSRADCLLFLLFISISTQLSIDSLTRILNSHLTQQSIMPFLSFLCITNSSFLLSLVLVIACMLSSISASPLPISSITSQPPPTWGVYTCAEPNFGASYATPHCEYVDWSHWDPYRCHTSPFWMRSFGPDIGVVCRLVSLPLNLSWPSCEIGFAEQKLIKRIVRGRLQRQGDGRADIPRHRGFGMVD
jgi:hypothetical protein